MTDHHEKEHSMRLTREAPSSADVATELGNLLVGLGILTMTLMPFALPGLLLGLLLVLPLLPLALLILPFWLARLATRALRRRLGGAWPTEPVARQAGAGSLRPGTG
jgi:hypothetical protein